MTVSQLRLTGACNGVPLTPVDARVTLDESRAPFASVDLVVPYDATTYELLDPRQSPAPRVTLLLEQRFGSSETFAALSADYAGGTLADLSADYVGQRFAALSNDYGTAWNAGGLRRTRRRRLNLALRGRVRDVRAGTVRLTAASDEALLVDYGLISNAPVTPATLTVLGAVQAVLDVVLPGAVLDTTDGAQTISAESAAWAPGVSAWSYLSPLTASAGLRLWCDPSRVWHLADPATVTAPGQVALSTANTVKDATESVSRDADEWYDGVVIEYVWTDASNVRRTAYDVAGDVTTTRTLHIRHDRPFPRAGEAAARLRKMQGHGRVLTIRAVADPEVYPATAASLTVPGAPTQTGSVESVTWNLPADDMDVTTRGLIDTPSTSWAFGATGQAWTDVPAGMTWNTFNWTGVAP